MNLLEGGSPILTKKYALKFNIDTYRKRYLKKNGLEHLSNDILWRRCEKNKTIPTLGARKVPQKVYLRFYLTLHRLGKYHPYEVTSFYHYPFGR